MSEALPRALELRDVEKRFGRGETEVRALGGVSLAVDRGELVAVMGPSGSGKSTLLHLAAGLEHPTGGRVLVGGQDLATLGAPHLAALRRRTVGVVFQRLNLVPTLTAVENVALPLELEGVRTREARRRAAAELDRVGLDGPIDRYPDDLSGGQQQRVAIARALVGERSLLLADEPTGALDSVAGDAIIDLLAEIVAAGRCGCLLVTHEARFAASADRMVRIRDGELSEEVRLVQRVEPVEVGQG